MTRTSLAILFASTLALAAAVQAQQCTTHTTSGRYLVKCDGFVTPGPNAPMVPAKSLAVALGDKDGNFTGAGTISVGGTILQQTVSGTEKLNSDCTGTITYQQTLNGQPGPPIDITFVVSKEGRNIDGLVTDAGAVFACSLTRME